MFGLEIGKIYLIATIRMFVVGKVEKESLGAIMLRDAVWIRDLGANGFARALKNGVVARWQRIGSPEGRWIISTGSIQGVGEWAGVFPPKITEME